MFSIVSCNPIEFSRCFSCSGGDMKCVRMIFSNFPLGVRNDFAFGCILVMIFYFSLFFKNCWDSLAPSQISTSSKKP